VSLLEVADLTVEFASGGYVVRPLDRLSLAAEDGELVVLLGPSGCGKTTLLSCLAGLLTPTSGAIRFGGSVTSGLSGRDLTRFRRETVGVVFQAFNLIPSLTALGNVVAPMRLAGVERRAAKVRATELLERVGLGDRLHHRPGALSGGQQQRVAIARALVHDPPLVLADEPTAHLDHIQVEGVLGLLRDLASPGRVVLVSTHDDRVTNLADRVVEMAPRSAGLDADREPEVLDLRAGEIVFEQGSRGDLVYVVEKGQVEIVRELADGGEERLAIVRAGDYFGELGPVLNLPRSATARAKTSVVLTACTVRRFRRRFPAA
jgi:putative ABC transport system ATP-binding protein